MRVMLINPKFRLPIDTRTTPHLGLAYLAAVSESRGDEVFLFDADVEDEPVSDAVQRFRPDIVGITANTPQVKQAWRTAEAIKSVKDVPIVIGGPHPSVLPIESAERSEIDVVARGEGEEIWLEVCDVVERCLAADPDFTARDLLDPQAAKKKKIEFNYRVFLRRVNSKREDFRRKLVKRNKITFNKLPPGEYRFRYRVRITRNKKLVARTPTSPPKYATVARPKF